MCCGLKLCLLVKSTGSLNLLLACNHARIFQGVGGEGVVMLCQSEGTHQIVMSFAMCCLLKKGLQKGGWAQAPQESPSYVPVYITSMSRTEGAFQVYIVKHF